MNPSYFPDTHYSDIPNLDEELITHLKAYHITSKLEDDFGFKNHPFYSRVLVNDDKGLVIKQIYISDRGRKLDKVPTLVVPTFYISDIGGSTHLVIQPIVDTSEASFRIVDEYIRSLSWDERQEQFGADAHCGNIGMYNGKPAVFDW